MRIKIKQLLSITLVITMLLSMMQAISAVESSGFDNFKNKEAYQAGMFSDVSDSQWYFSSVVRVYELGLMKGTGDDLFNVEGDLTIAETITIAARLNSLYTKGHEDFKQSKEVWYQTYIDYAKQNNIISNDYSDYNKEATRAEFAQIIAKAIPKEALVEVNPIEDDAIPDVKIGDTYGDEVYMLYRAGVLVGSEETGDFYPNTNIGRAESAAIITRIVDIQLRQSIALGATHKVSYNLNYPGSQIYLVQTIAKGRPARMPNDPDRNHFVFKGWYTTASCKTKADFSSPVNKDMVLYAKWIANSSMNLGGGGGGSASDVVNKPTALPTSSSVNIGTQLTLTTNTSGAEIRYTFGDGEQEEPTLDTGIIYNENSKPLINSTGTYKVKAFKAGMKASDTLTISYTIKDAITGTAYSQEDIPLSNVTLTFTSSEDVFTVQTDNMGCFSTHIRTGIQYQVTSENLLVVGINSNGNLGGIQVTNDIGKIELGKILISEGNEIVLQPGTFYFYDDFGVHVNHSPNSSTVTFDLEMDFIPGDIIILPPTPDSLGGLAVKVESILISEGTTILETSTPELKEVFASIKGNLSTNLQAQNFTPEQGVEIQSGLSSAITHTASLNDMRQASDPIRISLTAGDDNWTIEGGIELTGDVTGEIDWAWELDLMDSFDFNIEAQQVFTGNFQYENTTSGQFEKQLGEFHIPTQIPGITIDVPVNFVINAEGKVSTELSITTNQNIGIRYDDINGTHIYPDQKFHANANEPNITIAGGIKTGLEISQVVAVSGINMIGISEELGFYGDLDAQVVDNRIKVDYGVYISANVTVPLIDWDSDAFEQKFPFGSVIIENENIKDFRIIPIYLEIAPGEVKTLLLQVKNSNDEWVTLSEEQDELISFTSNYNKITYLGRGNIQADSDASSTTAIITFSLGGFTDSTTVKVVTEVGTLQGVVKDAETNNPLQGVSVIIYDGNLDVNRSATTNSTGQFIIEVPVGDTYKAIIQKEGYITESYESIEINANESTYLEPILQVNENYSGLGIVSGTIVNALDGNGISGLTINLRKGINVRSGEIVVSTTTISNGLYSFEDLEAGNYTGEIVGEGYNTGYFTIICLGGITKSGQNTTVTPNLPEGQTRIVLTWGSEPSDLDSHLTGPTTDGDRFHVFYSNKTYQTYVDLDLDDTSSYGPETTTIRQQIGGVYRFTIHDYTNRSSLNTTALSNSNAIVKVYIADQLVATYHVPANQGGNVWTVFELNGTTITPINQMSYDMININPNNTLRIMRSTVEVLNDIELLLDLPEKKSPVSDLVLEEPIDKQLEEPVIEEPALEEPVLEEPALEDPVLEETELEEPVLEETELEEPVLEEPVLEETELEEPVLEETELEEPKL